MISPFAYVKITQCHLMRRLLINRSIAGSSEDDDAITSCAAINATINAADDAGRIAGYIYHPESSEISNNFALAGMVAGGAAGFNAGDIQNHGIDKSDAALKTQSPFR